MFQGSRNVASGEHFTRLMAEGGRLNATTWFDRTNYFETVPKGAYELALWMEADRHGHLLDAVNQENLDNQRDVVKEEKRQRYDNVALRQRADRGVCRGVPSGAPLPPPDDRVDGGPRRREPGGRARLLPPLLRAQQHRADPRRRPHSGGGVRRRRALLRRPPGLGRAGPAAPAPARADQRSRCGSSAPRTCPTTGCTSPSGCRWTTPTSSSPPRLALDALGGLATSRLVQRLVRREQVANAAQAHAMGFVDGVSLGLHRPRRRRRPGPRRRRGRASSRSSSGSPRTGPTDGRDGVRAGPVRAVLAARPGQPGGAGRPDQPARPAARRPAVRQHLPRPARGDHARAGPGRRRPVAAARTAVRSSPTSSPRRGGAARPGAEHPAPGRHARRSRWAFPEPQRHALGQRHRAADLRHPRPVRRLGAHRRCPSRCPPSRASARASRRSWRGCSTRAPPSTRPRSSPSCWSARGSRSGGGHERRRPERRPRRAQASSRQRRSTCCARPWPSRCSPGRGRPPPQDQARRDRAGAGPRAAARRPRVHRDLLRRRRPGLAAQRRHHARRSRRIDPRGHRRLPRRARRARAA